jgi:hypothetical protein
LKKTGHERLDFFLVFEKKKTRSIFYSEILLLVNLCVALANGYITPLPPSADDIRSASNPESTPVVQQTAPTTKKGAKGDQQISATTGGSSGSSSSSIKNEDLKSALEVNHFIKKKFN